MGWFSNTEDKIVSAVQTEFANIKKWVKDEVFDIWTKVNNVQNDMAFLEARVKELEEKVEELLGVGNTDTDIEGRLTGKALNAKVTPKSKKVK